MGATKALTILIFACFFDRNFSHLPVAVEFPIESMDNVVKDIEASKNHDNAFRSLMSLKHSVISRTSKLDELNHCELHWTPLTGLPSKPPEMLLETVIFPIQHIKWSHTEEGAHPWKATLTAKCGPNENQTIHLEVENKDAADKESFAGRILKLVPDADIPIHVTTHQVPLATFINHTTKAPTPSIMIEKEEQGERMTLVIDCLYLHHWIKEIENLNGCVKISAVIT